MAPVPVALGPRSWIRLRKIRGFTCSLATIADGDQESAVNLRYKRNAEVVRCLYYWLWTSPSKSQREVRFMATRYLEPFRRQTRQCDERYACSDFEGQKWPRASIHRRPCQFTKIFMMTILLTIRRTYYLNLSGISYHCTPVLYPHNLCSAEYYDIEWKFRLYVYFFISARYDDMQQRAWKAWVHLSLVATTDHLRSRSKVLISTGCVHWCSEQPPFPGHLRSVL